MSKISDLDAQIASLMLIIKNHRTDLQLIRADIDFPHSAKIAYAKAQERVSAAHAELDELIRRMEALAKRVDLTNLSAQYEAGVDKLEELGQQLCTLNELRETTAADAHAVQNIASDLEKAKKLFAKLPLEAARELLASLCPAQPNG